MSVCTAITAQNSAKTVGNLLQHLLSRKDIAAGRHNESEQFAGKSETGQNKKKRLTQEQLAKAIAEKASVIQRMESGHSVSGNLNR